MRLQGRKGKGKGECCGCGGFGHRAYECKDPTRRGKGKGFGKGDWQSRWPQQDGAHTISPICCLKETNTNIDEDGFTEVRPGEAAKALQRGVVPKEETTTTKRDTFKIPQEEDE